MAEAAKRKPLSLPLFFGLSLTRQSLSDYLLLLLPAFTSLPGALTLGFVTYIYLGVQTTTACERVWDSTPAPLTPLPLPASSTNFAQRVLIFFAVYAFSGILWTLLVLRIRPASFIRYYYHYIIYQDYVSSLY